MQALQYLKQNPRDEEPNRLVLLRGERLYEEAMGDTRVMIDRAMMEFDRALKKKDRMQIQRAREKLEKFLDEIEYGEQ
jgi:molecular chaperone HscC